ncbi:MAG TPA: hypothetical protein PKL58_02280 [Methylophilaceae bacterium]|jgi:hypothetical protein|nr:hypothetical protein [Methylotenera sp.]HNZ56166.1 hypothetical protein [Methylophilaceae bacterium]
MQKLSEEKLLARDAKRDLNAELLESINNLNAGKVVRVSIVARTGHIIESPVEKMLLAVA